jgi:hypothetical protein
MNNVFFKIEYKIKLTDILNILKVPTVDFLNVNKKINKNFENIIIKDLNGYNINSYILLNKDKIYLFDKNYHLLHVNSILNIK